ncbi:hypothetical protein AWB79_06775 [Caballeronia hypogeia]|uniref:Uncharacterized protein n=2 Tax=Caballeronia TaxID=1827195 RepID=A0A158DE99_9BURK|nr:hypothetical protein [Caballeronia hypogeia]SAK92117.1 hypothetical protein AWB79_06775 [Caballeronia hypogeia]
MSTAHARFDFCKGHANIRKRMHEYAGPLIPGPARMFGTRPPPSRQPVCWMPANNQAPLLFARNMHSAASDAALCRSQ